MDVPVIRIGRSEYRVARSPILIETLGLGSCLALVLYDPVVRVGGMAHIMLPYRREMSPGGYGGTMDLGKFADSALDAMLKQMKRMGARLGQLEGMIFGGADMFADILNKNVLAIGERNIAAALEQLNSNRIPLVAEETGGSVGRTVILNTQDGSVMVRSAKDEERLYRRERRVWPLVS